MLRLIVFDWDGTLADSVSKIIKCKHFLSNKYNLPMPSEAQIRDVQGMSFEKAMKKSFPTASEMHIRTMKEEFHSLMKQSNYQAELFPNARECLESLKAQGMKLAIATSKDRKELETAIAHTGLTGFFHATCCGSEYQEKPHPAMLKHLMESFQVSTDECLMIGDTITDVMFATNADIRIVCATYGAHQAFQLQSLNPYALIDDLAQLKEIMGKGHM